MEGERPLGSYAAFASVFATALAGFVAAERRRLPAEPRWSDTVLIALATHKLARLIAKDEVTTFVRVPVTVDEDATEPERRGFRRAAGELVTCPYCLGLWISAGFSAATALWPRESRFVAAIFAAHAGADLLHATFTRLRAT